MGTTWRREREIGWHDESVLDRLACKPTAFYHIVDGDVIRLAGKNSGRISERSQPLKESLSAGRRRVRHRRGSGRDRLKLCPLMHLDRVVTLAFVADGIMRMDLRQVVRRRIFPRKPLDDLVGGELLLPGFVRLAIDTKIYTRAVPFLTFPFPSAFL